MTEPAIRSVGVPREVKTAEHRVAMTPDGVRELERHGIQVCVEAGAGEGASITDADYVAAGMEAEVVLIDKNLDRLRWVDQIHRGRIMTLASNRGAIERSVADADLVIGAVLVAGGRAPVVVSEEMVKGMKA